MSGGAHGEEDSAEQEEDGMPSPPSGDGVRSASAPRVIAAEALTPQMRDALVASGPDWDLVRWMDSSNQAFCIADPSSPDMPLAYVSPGFEVLTGYASRDVIGRNCRFLQGPGTDPAARQRMAKALRAGSGCVEVVLNYRQDGAPFWNRVLIAPLRDATGAVRSYVSVQSCVSKSLTALAGLARPQADGVAAPAPPPSQRAAIAFSIVPGQPSSFSAVQPPQARASQAAVTHNPEAAFAFAAEARAAAEATSRAAKGQDEANDDDDNEEPEQEQDVVAGAGTDADVSSAPVTPRAAGHGTAISDADAAMLISQIAQTDAAVAVAVKRERGAEEGDAVEPAGTRTRL
jgi:PAS domain S-box-containing protein